MLSEEDRVQPASDDGNSAAAASGSEVVGHVEIDEWHHQGSGMVHGGVYALVIESMATIGASAAVREIVQGPARAAGPGTAT